MTTPIDRVAALRTGVLGSQIAYQNCGLHIDQGKLGEPLAKASTNTARS